VTPSVQSLQYLRDLVHKRSAIVVEGDKDYLLESRLGPLAKKSGLASIDELVARVRENELGPLASAVIEAMTTNETSFFRDAHPFEALRNEIVPKLIAQRTSSRTLRIWCAAASTGQEPYSVAMLLREHFPALASWSVQIVATDLNATVLARARTGLFKQLEVNRGLPAPLLLKYFDRVGAEWQIKADIRSMVSFQELNLLDRWPFSSAQDVMFIRNVIIYFDLPTKRTLLGRARQQLRQDGYLVLGGAETTLNLDDGYAPVRIGSGVYYQPKPLVVGGAAEGRAAHAAR
jgi:chemotaxis protein methyltransferase CheR